MSEYIVKCHEVVGIGGETLIVPDYIDTSKEIVRCRDCTNYEPNDYIHFTCEYLHRRAKPYDYCAWGERKERIES